MMQIEQSQAGHPRREGIDFLHHQGAQDALAALVVILGKTLRRLG